MFDLVAKILKAEFGKPFYKMVKFSDRERYQHFICLILSLSDSRNQLLTNSDDSINRKCGGIPHYWSSRQHWQSENPSTQITIMLLNEKTFQIQMDLTNQPNSSEYAKQEFNY